MLHLEADPGAPVACTLGDGRQERRREFDPSRRPAEPVELFARMAAWRGRHGAGR